MGTRSFPGVKSGRGVTLTPHPFLVPWSWKSRAIPLLPLWAVRPVQGLSACTSVHFTYTPWSRSFLRSCKVLSWSRNSPHCMDPKVHYFIYKHSPSVLILRQINLVHVPHPISWRSNLILSSHLCLGIPSGLFPSGFPTTDLYTPLLSPYMLYALPISLFSIWSPEQYLVRSTNH